MKDYYRFSYFNYIVRAIPDFATGFVLLYVILVIGICGTLSENGTASMIIFDVSFFISVLALVVMAYWRSLHTELHWQGTDGIRFKTCSFSLRRMRLEERTYNVTDISYVRPHRGALLVHGNVAVEIRPAKLFSNNTSFNDPPIMERLSSVHIKRYYKTQHQLTKRLYAVSQAKKSSRKKP